MRPLCRTSGGRRGRASVMAANQTHREAAADWRLFECHVEAARYAGRPMLVVWNTDLRGVLGAIWGRFVGAFSPVHPAWRTRAEAKSAYLCQILAKPTSGLEPETNGLKGPGSSSLAASSALLRPS